MNRESIHHVFGYTLCFALYLFIYSSFIVDVFGYMGYEDNLSATKTAIAALGICFCAFLIRNKNLPSEYFLHLTLSLVVLPTLVLFAGSNLPYIFAGTTLLAYSLLSVTTRLVTFKTIKTFRIKTPSILLHLLLIASAATVLSIFAFGGGTYFNLNLAMVYEFRSEAADNLPGIFSYINPIITKVAIPFGVIIALQTRRWSALFALLMCAVLLFALTAHKSILAYPIVALTAYHFSKNGRYAKLLIYSLLSIGLLSILELNLLRNSDFGYWFSSLIFRRAILTPSFLNLAYIDWFGSNPTYFWADSRVTLGLVSPPSHLSSPHLIGYQLYGSEDMSANTGWIGSGFANAGIFGVVLYTVLIGILLSFLNSYSRKLGTPTIIAIFSSLILTVLLSADFLTSLLTHGLLVATMIVVISPKTCTKEY